MLESGTEARFEVEELPGRDIAVLTLRDSYLNYASADELKPPLKATVTALMDDGRRNFILDLGGVGVMDSCGLAVLISLKKLIDARDGRLVLSDLSVMIERLFLLTKLDRAFEIHPTQVEAAAAI